MKDDCQSVDGEGDRSIRQAVIRRLDEARHFS